MDSTRQLTTLKTATDFQSPTFGRLSFDKMLGNVAAYMREDSSHKYRLIIGSDSQSTNSGEKQIDYVTAFIVHRIGAGGIYFWNRTVGPRVYSLRERIYTEALLSLQVAQNLIENFSRFGIAQYDLEIHVDVGNHGETREMINEVVGMIRSNGFKVKTKPDSYGASKVADRYT